MQQYSMFMSSIIKVALQPFGVMNSNETASVQLLEGQVLEVLKMSLLKCIIKGLCQSTIPDMLFCGKLNMLEKRSCGSHLTPPSANMANFLDELIRSKVPKYFEQISSGIWSNDMLSNMMIDSSS